MLRWFITVILCAAFLGLGMSVAILGPTFQDLATNVNSNISSLSLIFVGRAFGFLSGSVIGGVLLDNMNHFLLLGVSMLATTVGLYLVPFCKKAVLLIVMMSVFGVSIGILDTEWKGGLQNCAASRNRVLLLASHLYRALQLKTRRQ